tara:strand:- start:373 stop:777 length:405 start_codon:yes stop_codon:yes gene_type:complete
MASILRVNTLTDASSNNSVPMATVAEGSNKQWSNYSGSGTTFRDSFNTASATDNGTGQYTITLTSSMSTDNNAYLYSNNGNTSSEVQAFTTGGDRQFAQIRAQATNSYGIQPVGDDGAQQDGGLNCSTVLGDLA